MSSFEVVCPMTGEVSVFEHELNLENFQLQKSDFGFIVVEQGKRFTVGLNELFKVTAGVYYVRQNHNLGVLRRGPYLANMRFPLVADSLSAWLKFFLQRPEELKALFTRSFGLGLAQVLTVVCACALALFVLLPRALQTNYAIAPTLERGDARLGLLFRALESAAAQAPRPQIPVASSKVARPIAKNAALTRVQGPSRRTCRAVALDPDVARFLSAKQRRALAQREGACDAKK